MDIKPVTTMIKDIVLGLAVIYLLLFIVNAMASHQSSEYEACLSVCRMESSDDPELHECLKICDSRESKCPQPQRAEEKDTWGWRW